MSDLNFNVSLDFDQVHRALANNGYVVFHGDDEGDVAEWLRSAGWSVVTQTLYEAADALCNEGWSCYDPYASVDDILGDLDGTEVARCVLASGYNELVLNEMDADDLVEALKNHHHDKVASALTDAGFHQSIEDVSDEDLIAEVQRRLRERSEQAAHHANLAEQHARQRDEAMKQRDADAARGESKEWKMSDHYNPDGTLKRDRKA